MCIVDMCMLGLIGEGAVVGGKRIRPKMWGVIYIVERQPWGRLECEGGSRTRYHHSQ